MPYDFPSSPTTGQIVTGPGGAQWQWDGVKWTVITSGSPGFAPINNPIFTGDPQAPTPALTDSDQSLATTAFTQGVVAPVRTLSADNVGRNLLHNGLFNIQQRGAGPWTTNGSYTADRWYLQVNADTVSVSLIALADSDRTTIGDETALWASQYNFVGSSTASAFTMPNQRVENVRRLSGKQVTVSFWAHATSGTPKLGVGYSQTFGAGGSPSTSIGGNLGVTPNLSATWQRYTVTGAIPSATGKTFGTTAGSDFSIIEFWLSDQGSFAARSGGIGVQSGTVQFWGMQLEIGSVATPLEKLDPQTDLANCQRFYHTGQAILQGYGNAGQGFTYGKTFPVAMRAYPSVFVPNWNAANINTGTATATSVNDAYFGGIAISTSYCSFQAPYTASADL